MRQNVSPPRAPNVAAAPRKRGSILVMTDSMVSTASGISACTMPIIVPVKL